ncbi:MAG: hypothetical protein CMJ18_15015 [Phycisphaeraceae bacterium]|nr:hypothetical protein [Phycisphaeraceae bacterium]
MQRLSSRATRRIGMYFGERFPFHYVCEYPKSGGTWLAKMLSDYLDAPFISHHSVMPVGCRSVIHSHWKYDRRLRRAVYLYRDGRDVMVSFYFQRMLLLRQEPDAPFCRMLRRRYDEAFGAGYDPDDVRSLLPRFIELEMLRPRTARLNWPDHIANWWPGRGRHVHFVSYEQLRDDAAAAMTACLEALGEAPVDAPRVADTIRRHEFAAQTGRAPGDEDRNDFRRKGIVGDWKNHFTPEAARAFDRHAGDMLVRLGYEQDRSWVERVAR